jgi:hypothetical protein
LHGPKETPNEFQDQLSSTSDFPSRILKASEAFHEKFGFVNVMSSGFECKEGRGLVAMMQHGKIILELYQLSEAQLEGIRSRKDGHIDHIAFDVDDIDSLSRS